MRQVWSTGADISVILCEFSPQDDLSQEAELYQVVCVHVCTVIRTPACPWIYATSVVSWLLERKCRADIIEQ